MKYIIDVTQLVHWQGRLTGIPRVVQELAIRFPSKDREVVFVSWVKEVNDMCEVNLDATLAIRGNGIEYVKNGTAPQVVVKPQDTIVGSSKPSLVRRSKTFTKKVLRKAGVEDSALVTKFRRDLHHKELLTYKRLSVKKNDVFFIGAGEWWDNNFIDLVLGYHQKGIKIVQISHDLLPIVTPQFSGHATESMSIYNSKIMPIADLVLANSEATKKDVAHWLTSKKLHVPKIEVFRIGEDFTIEAPVKPSDPAFSALNLKGNDFIISVGTIEARKNHALLYYTYKLAVSRGIKLPILLIVGRRGWKTDDIYEYMTNDPQTKNIVPLHDVSDNELSWLYDHALFSIYPSFYEGWGMPIAESIMRGTPAVASNTSSMPEVAPGFANYFNPSSTDELLDVIIAMLQPGALEKEKAKIKGYVPTSWDDSFTQVFNYLENL